MPMPMYALQLGYCVCNMCGDGLEYVLAVKLDKDKGVRGCGSKDESGIESGIESGMGEGNWWMEEWGRGWGWGSGGGCKCVVVCWGRGGKSNRDLEVCM